MPGVLSRGALGVPALLGSALLLLSGPASADVRIGAGPLVVFEHAGDAEGTVTRVLDLGLFRLGHHGSESDGGGSWSILDSPLGVGIAAFDAANPQYETLEVLKLPLLGAIYRHDREGIRTCYRVLFLARFCRRDEP